MSNTPKHMPGFTAEAALYETSGSYCMTVTVASTSQVLPQQRDLPWVRRCTRRCDPGGWCEIECHTLAW
jgi:hypothetical protein